MMTPVSKKHKAPRPPPAKHPLPALVRERLQALGDFGHLLVVLRGDHIIIAQPGPPEDPNDSYPVLRLSGIGQFRFGLSFYDPAGRWQPVPISGTLDEVLADAVKIRGSLLEPDSLIPDTSGMVC